MTIRDSGETLRDLAETAWQMILCRQARSQWGRTGLALGDNVFFSFSDLFHEGLHDGTASNAQNHELVRSRPVAMLKLNIIVTLNMLETNFATLHTKNTIVIKIEKWQIVLIEGLSRVAVRRIDHQQLLTEIVIS